MSSGLTLRIADWIEEAEPRADWRGPHTRARRCGGEGRRAAPAAWPAGCAASWLVGLGLMLRDVDLADTIASINYKATKSVAHTGVNLPNSDPLREV